MPTKQCSKCKEFKELNQFYRRKKSESRLKSTCINCDKKNNSTYISLPFDTPGTTKNCSKCGIEQTLNEFPKDKHKKDGFSTRCSKCHREYNFLKKYGMTIKEYNIILESQNNVCAICKKPKNENQVHNITRKPTFLPVDHDHKTGKVRGILCSNCNKGIGFLKDSPELLEIAAFYLRLYGNK